MLTLSQLHLPLSDELPPSIFYCRVVTFVEWRKATGESPPPPPLSPLILELPPNMGRAYVLVRLRISSLLRSSLANPHTLHDSILSWFFFLLSTLFLFIVPSLALALPYFLFFELSFRFGFRFCLCLFALRH